MSKSIETKRQKRRLIVYEVLFIVLLAIAGIVFFVNHTFAVLSIPLLLGGLIFSAFYLRLSLINNGSNHSVANWWWGSIAIPSVLLCGCLFWLEIFPVENKSTQPLLTNAAESKPFVLTMPSQEPKKPTIEEQINFYSKQAAARQWQPPELPPQLPDISGGGKMVYIKYARRLRSIVLMNAFKNSMRNWDYLRLGHLCHRNPAQELRRF
jgi:hypothetical protein